MLGARLSVLSLCCLLWACGQGQETQQATQLFCDDKSVEEAVDSALVKLNGFLTTGNQYALYQILEAKKVGYIFFSIHLFNCLIVILTFTVQCVDISQNCRYSVNIFMKNPFCYIQSLLRKMYYDIINITLNYFRQPIPVEVTLIIFAM